MSVEFVSAISEFLWVHTCVSHIVTYRIDYVTYNGLHFIKQWTLIKSWVPQHEMKNDDNNIYDHFCS